MWTAVDPESKLLRCVEVGGRTMAMAHTVLHQLARLLAPGCVPLFVRDGYPNYLPAIVTHCGHWVQPPRRQIKGPAPTPRWMPLPGLLYAQVVNTMRRRQLGNTEAVIALAQRRLQRNPNHFQSLAALAWAYAQAGQTDRQRQTCQELLDRAAAGPIAADEPALQEAQQIVH